MLLSSSSIQQHHSHAVTDFVAHPIVVFVRLFPQDIGWKPFVESWAATREDANERQVLPSLFEKYIEATRTIVRKGFKEATPLRVLNKVQRSVLLIGTRCTFDVFGEGYGTVTLSSLSINKAGLMSGEGSLICM